jgi:hypothetical protein
MGFKLTYLSVPILFLLACNTGPDFERTNQHDPGSQNFKPNSAELRNRVISPEKWVTLSWVDNTDFEDGYIIEKRLSRDDTYVTLFKLGANNTSYTDKTGELTPTTSYKVSPFVYIQAGDSTFISKGDPQVMDLNLRRLGDVKLFDRGGTIEINWQNSLEYFDALIFGHRNITRDQQSITWTDTIRITEISIEELNENRRKTILNPFDGFTYEVYVNALISDPAGEYQSFSINSDIIRLNRPIFTSSGFVDEETVVFEWRSNVENVDYYEIFEYSRNHPHDAPPNYIDRVNGDINEYEYHYDRPYERFSNGVRLALRSVINDDKSPISEQFNHLNITNLENFRLTPGDQSLALTWDLPPFITVPYTRILVERAVNDIEQFSLLAELPPDATSFVDTNISEENNYYYRVRSASSRNTPIAGANFSSGLVVEDQFNLTGNVSITSMSPDAAEVGYLISSDWNTAYFSDLLGNTRTITDPEARFFSVRFSPDGNHIVLTADGWEVPKTMVYDRNTLTPVYQFYRENLNEPFLLISDTEKILKTSYLSEFDPELSINVNKTQIRIIDMQSEEVVIESDKLVGNIQFMSYDQLRNRFIMVSAVRNNPRTIFILDADSLNVLDSYTISFPTNVTILNYYETSNTLFYSRNSDLYEFDVNSLTTTHLFTLPRELRPGQSAPRFDRFFIFIEDDNLYAFKIGFSGIIYFYDPETQQISIAYRGLTSINHLDYLRDQKKVVIQEYGTNIYFMNIEEKWTVIETH